MTLNVILCAFLVFSRNEQFGRCPGTTGGPGMSLQRSTSTPGQTFLEPHIQRRDTNYRKAISVKHRVPITVWRLATNVEYRTLSHLFGVGVSTVGSIVRECWRVIHDELTPRYVRMPTGDDFDRMLDGFETR